MPLDRRPCPLLWISVHNLWRNAVSDGERDARAQGTPPWLRYPTGVAKKRQTFGKIQREREEKRERKLEKKQEKKAAALAEAEAAGDEAEAPEAEEPGADQELASTP